MGAVNRRSVITLYSDPDALDSHRVRFVLAEKGIDAHLVSVDPLDPPEDLQELNPYCTTPTLVDRELSLYDPRVIVEYLDERYPHPPLMPVDPVSRAKARLVVSRVETDWYPLAAQLAEGKGRGLAAVRKELAEGLLASDPLFRGYPFLLSEELSVMDCAVLPVLWRLPALGVELPGRAEHLHAYMERMFARPSFRKSLSDIEKTLRD
ncbi:glutathione S-transferase N-terminal domain-containing protein [Alkalilimnicola ehrlichii MLHE-1]|uniref:Glutathione S-transferase n=1 Tax=Alkalilimnicola ehrlichii (strain ATCC BAA-1101 / DSM 17681 / MLHE-1) TaxID=187272 RepID=Q0A6I7_ALKEH|nr:glutathione S-transferase N-terminal domain-containing protein [Alkalilimnicola ehrlichii]ABI57550.1 Glutathione S-transferase [Alkalilimnicola ehrlichii MLHE-1]